MFYSNILDDHFFFAVEFIFDIVTYFPNETRVFFLLLFFFLLLLCGWLTVFDCGEAKAK